MEMLLKMHNGTAILKNSLAIFYKVKHILTIQPSNPTPRYYPREIKIHVYTKIC